MIRVCECWDKDGIVAEMVAALLHGWLEEVDWDKRTAQLRRIGEGCVRLRFPPSLDGEMARLASQYVQVGGHGHLSRDDRWTTVRVERIEGDRSCWEPFDMEAFLNNPNPKIFKTDEIITASEPFDVDDFVRIIHEGRDVERKEPID